MKRTLAVVMLGLSLACATAPRPANEVQSIDPLLSSINHHAIPPEQLKGKVLLVDIWASWCQPCTDALPFLASLRDELNSPDLEIVTVNVDADHRAGQAFLRQLGLENRLLVLNDPEAKHVEQLLGIMRLPTSVFVDRSGRVRFVESGFFSNTKDATRAHLRQLLAESQPTAAK